MFSSKTTPLSKAGVLNKLVGDYLEKRNELRAFYSYYPSRENFKEAINSGAFTTDRQTLVSILKKQAQLVTNTSAASIKNIELLSEPKAYTITTGHQLCLFTGPLYFIYKILSVINLCEELNSFYPENKFIPVYWAASEDHDFDEVNHFNAFNKTIRWESTQSGAVGNFNTSELSMLFDQVKELFGTGTNGLHLSELFKKSYLENRNLADATRYLVNELFGRYGLVIVDGNDPAFKAQFKDQFKKDIFESVPYKNVSKSIEELHKLGYESQVNPRPINCFYCEPGLRSRIEKDGESYNLVGTDKKFSHEELNHLIDTQPEKISPNVVLRPVYQQTILPNIAYIGGPGELAYWLEYKSMFDELKTGFPLLVPRSFLTVIDKGVKAKMDKLGFEPSDIFKDELELIRLYQEKSNNIFELEKEKKELEKLFSTIAEKIVSVDKTLAGNVSAEQQKAINSLDAIAGKANRALKQKSETELNQVKFIKDRLYPGKIPQERYENFSTFFVRWGRDFIDAVKPAVRPLELCHTSLTEE